MRFYLQFEKISDIISHIESRTLSPISHGSLAQAGLLFYCVGSRRKSVTLAAHEISAAFVGELRVTEFYLLLKKYGNCPRDMLQLTKEKITEVTMHGYQ